MSSLLRVAKLPKFGRDMETWLLLGSGYDDERWIPGDERDGAGRALG